MIVTVSPADPHVGVNEVMVGAHPPTPVVARKVAVLVMPVAALPGLSRGRCSWSPASKRRPGTSAQMVVSAKTEKLAAFELASPAFANATAVSTRWKSLKPVPVTTTTQPAGPLVGANAVMVTAANAGAWSPSTIKATRDPDSRYPAADMPLLQTHSIVLTFRIDRSLLCFD